MKKIYLALIIGIFLLNLAPAQMSDIGSGKQGETIILTQICDDCTYVNITEVIRKGENSTILLSGEFEMTKVGNNFNFSFSDTNVIADYVYTACGDLNGVRTCQPVSFKITPSGLSGNANLVFFIFIILIIYAITFFGFFGKNIPITILGGMAMLFLGVYTIEQGIIIFRDALTIQFSYLTIAIGAIMALWAILEQFEVI